MNRSAPLVLAVAALPAAAFAQTAAPVARAVALQTQLNTAVLADLAPSISGAAITGIAIAGAPRNGTATVDGTRVRYVPARDFFGDDTFTYVAFGAGGASAQATVTVQIAGRPDASQDARVRDAVHAQSGSLQRAARAWSATVAQRQHSMQTGAHDTAEAAAATPARGYEAWAAGYNTHGAGHSMDLFAFGLERRYGAQLTAGAALARMREGDDGDAMRLRGTAGALYAHYALAPGWNLDAQLSHTRVALTSTRATALANSAELRRDARVHGAAFGAAYDYRSGKITLAPYARLDLQAYKLARAAETSAQGANLQYGALSWTALDASAGLRVKSMHEAEFGWVLPRAVLAWTAPLRDVPQQALSYLDGGGAVAVPGRAAASWRTLGVGVDIVLLNGLGLAFDYRSDKARGNPRTHTVLATLSAPLDGRGAPAALTEGSALVPSSLKIPFELSVQRDSNLSRAELPSERLSDTVSSLTVRQSWNTQLDDQVNLQLQGSLAGDALRRHNTLNRAQAALQGQLRYKLVPERDAAVYALFASVTGEAYRSTLRDGARYSAGVSVLKPISDNLHVYGALAHNVRHADSAVFSGAEHSARVELVYGRGFHGNAYASAEYRQGDTVSSGRPSLAALDISHVASVDDAFAGYTAYRYDGRSALYTLGYTLPFGPRNALDLNWRHVRTRADRGAQFSAFSAQAPRYVTDQVTLAYLTSF